MKRREVFSMHCPSCSSTAVLHDHERGEQICTRCGLVILERMFELEPEWRRRPGEGLERADLSAGIDVTQHDLGLGTKFGVPAEASPGWRARLRRMQVLQRRARVSDWEEKSLREALIELDKLCEDLALPKGVKAEISVHYRRMRAKKMTAGRGTYQVLGALASVACRLRGIPRTEVEISRALGTRFGLKERGLLQNLRKLTKLIARGLNLKLPRISADDFIDRFAPQLGLFRKTIEQAHEIHRSLPRSFTQAKPPLFLAAVALYIGAERAGEKVTLRKVADAMGVGVSSLSKNVARAKVLMGGG